MYRIYLVEDDRQFGRVIAQSIEEWGFEVKQVEDFNQVLVEFGVYQPALVLLDVNLPGRNGFYWCQAIRQVSKVPIIFISSRDDKLDMVMAISYGGDDYLTKPFDLQVLNAKMMALLRRTYDFGKPMNLMEHQGLLFDMSASQVTWQGKSAKLTHNEQQLLRVLFEYKGQVVSRHVLIEALWQSESFVDDNTLTVNVNRLRKKIEGIGRPGLIVTKKRMGYQLAD